MQSLLDRGMDVNSRGGCYSCTLQAAANNGLVESIQLLLDKGADVSEGVDVVDPMVMHCKLPHGGVKSKLYMYF